MTRHTSGTPAEILTHGASRAFGVGALIALAALLVSAFVIRGRRPKAGQPAAP